MAQSTPCPIMGDYTGEVPGSSGLCAKVASDCNNPDIMFHSVSSCENRSHVYEGKSILQFSFHSILAHLFMRHLLLRVLVVAVVTPAAILQQASLSSSSSVVVGIYGRKVVCPGLGFLSLLSVNR